MKPNNEIPKGSIVSVYIGKRKVKCRVVDIPEYDPIYLFERNESNLIVSPLNMPLLKLAIDKMYCEIIKN